MNNPWKRYSKVCPQREDGNRQINTDVLVALIRADLSAAEYKVVLFILHKTWGFNKQSDAIAVGQFCEATGLAKRTVRLVLQQLKSRRIVSYQVSNKRVQRGSPINEFLFNKHYDMWVSANEIKGAKSRKGAKSCQKRVNKIAPTIEKETIEIPPIVPLLKFEKKVPIPTPFPITDEMKNYAGRKGFTGDLKTMTENFTIHHRKVGSKWQDWYAAWQQWLRNTMNPPWGKKDEKQPTQVKYGDPEEWLRKNAG